MIPIINNIICQGKGKIGFDAQTGNKGRFDSCSLTEDWIASLVSSIDFREVLGMAGATVVDCKPDAGEYINLVPEALDKTTIIDLIA